MIDLALAILADDPATLRPTRQAALRAALVEVRAAVRLDAAAYIAIVRTNLAGCATTDAGRLALRDLDDAFDLLVPRHAGAYWASTEGATAPPGLWSLAVGIVALELALDPLEDVEARARLRVVGREIAKRAADAVHARVELRMTDRDIEIANMKGTAA